MVSQTKNYAFSTTVTDKISFIFVRIVCEDISNLYHIRTVFALVPKLSPICFGFALLRYTIGLENHVPVNHPIRSYSLAHVFPHFVSATFI